MGQAGSSITLQDGFVQLVGADLTDDDTLWVELWKNKQNVFTEIQAVHVRELRNLKPNNLRLLLRKSAERLELSAKGTNAETNELTTKCLQLLTRILPLLFERDESEIMDTIFWGKDQPAEGEAAASDDRPIAIRLIDAVLSVMFLPGFTIAAGQKYLFWEPGPGAHDTPSSGGFYDANRTHVLKCFMLLFSETLFRTPEEYRSTNCRWLEHVTSLDSSLSQRLFSSLLNVSLSYDPVGWGVPYAGVLNTDIKESLVDLCLQTLLIMLDFESRAPATAQSADAQSPPGGAAATVGEASAAAAATPHNNNILRCLEQLGEAKDFDFVFKGMSRLLNNTHQASSSYLPGSVKNVTCYQELFILFWKFLDKNVNFLHFILKTYDINQIIVPISYFVFDGCKDPSKVGLIHICTFILLLLSGERNFCVALNAPFTTKLPVTGLPNFGGNHADLVCIVLFRVMVEGREKLETLFDCFLTIVSNISPYIKSFCSTAAMKILSMFEHFAKERSLATHEHYHRFVVFFLEIFNNVIQYQYEGNASLIYQILQRKKCFENLATLQARTEETEASAASGEQAPKLPSLEWIKLWRDKPPFQTCLRLIRHLLPQVESFCESTGVTDEKVVIEFLKQTTMVGLLPVPHPILIRKYQPNDYTSLWFTTYIWGVIYLRLQSPTLFDPAHIKLFTITFIDS